MTQPLNLIGRIFSNLTVLARHPVNTKAGKQIVICRCTCGKELPVIASGLVNGNTKSCGCISAEQTRARFTKHGVRSNPIYHRWNSMMGRCYNPNSDQYHNYGARGIKVCDRWKNSPNLYIEDVGQPPFPTASLDRIDNAGDYSPSNFRWATKKEQSINRRCTNFIEFNGKTLSQTDWGLELFNNDQVVRRRLNRGWSVEEALTLPKHTKIQSARVL